MTGEPVSAAIPTPADSAPIVHLVLQKGNQTGLRIRCRAVATLIGSRPGCRITLPSKDVAPVHAVIVNNGHEVLAIDLLTRRGTLLNDLKMEHERLSDCDVLEIEPFKFQVEIVAAPRNGNGDLHDMDLDPTPNVIAFEHLESGRVLQPNRDVCILGRRNGCDIVVADPNVSRVHAIIFNYQGYPAIVDLLARNRTTVNGTAVQFQRLEDGDVIGVGESQFKVRLVGSRVTERASKKLKAMPPLTVTTAPVGLAPADDLIDIHAAEGGERWTVADNLERLERAAVKRKQAV